MKIYKLSSQILPQKQRKKIESCGHKLVNIKVTNKVISFKSGVESCFVQINKRHGIKAYSTRYSAEYAYNIQKKAGEEGLSPKVNGEVECMMIKIPKRDANWNEFSVGWNKVWFFKTQVANINEKKFKKFYREVCYVVGLFCKYIEKPFDYYDLHDENIGWIGNKPYVIDCGEMSTDP